MPRLSLRWRLNLTFAAVLALLLALDLALTVLGAGRRIDPEVANATALTGEILRDAVKGLSPDPDVATRLTDLAANLDRLRHVRVRFLAVGAPPRAPAETRPAPPAWFVALVHPRRTQETIEAHADGRLIGAFVVEGDPDDEIGELWDSLVTLALDGGASAALGFAVVYLVVNASLRPLDRLSFGLAALERRDYGARLEGAATPEIAPLLARFNALGASLSEAEAENRALRARLVSIQDEERKEIGRELHDEIGPHLFAARAQAGAARRVAADGPAAAPLDALIELIDSLQTTNRRILDRLRPAALEELGLEAALAALGRFFERNQPELRVEVEAVAPPGLSEGLEAALYRIAQEALTNAARHGRPGHVRIALAEEAGTLALTVEDDGRGLHPATPQGRGLLGIRERVAAYGGALTLSPAAPHGLRVRATFPFEAGAP